MSLIPDIAVTAVYFSFTLSIVEALRRTTRFLLLSLPLVELSVQEFLAAFELCAICFEINILLDYSHGVLLYAIFLFVASAWWDLAWTATASPYTYVVDWLFEGTPLPTMIVAVSSQILAGMTFYQFYIKQLWSLGYGDLHYEKIMDTSICYSDIHAPVIVAAVVEGGGVCVCILTTKLLSSTKLNSTIGASIDAFVSTSLVVSAMNISGGYYNSVLASATLYGCFGSTVLEHFTVYWVGETIGAIVAYFIWEKQLKNLVAHDRPKSD